MHLKPFIPLYFNLNTHPKFIKLCVLLNQITTDDRLLLRAKLENLWLWTMQYFPLGIIENCTPQEIALACCWQDNPLDWITALIECRFIEPVDNGFKIIQWEQYGGKYISKRQQDALRKQRTRHPDMNDLQPSLPKSNALPAEYSPVSASITMVQASPKHNAAPDSTSNPPTMTENLEFICDSSTTIESPTVLRGPCPTHPNSILVSDGCHADMVTSRLDHFQRIYNTLCARMNPMDAEFHPVPDNRSHHPPR